MKLGVKIKVARVAKGWSQQNLADEVFVSRGLIGHIEQRNEGAPETLKKIEKALGIKLLNEAGEIEETVLDYQSAEKQVGELKKQVETLERQILTLVDLIDKKDKAIERLKSQSKKSK